MRRKNARITVVNNPGKGLLKNLPPDLQKNQAKEYLTEAKNVRVEDGSLKSAPGHERVEVTPKNLQTPANLIHQANITSADEESRKIPVIGTDTSLYTVEKRSSEYACVVGGENPYGPCTLKFAATSDSGSIGEGIKKVSNAMRKKEPDVVLHAGDIVYADGGSGDPDTDNYEEQLAQWYSWAMGQYGGAYTGGDENYLFPVLGNHDWDDGPGTKYLGFFDLPGNEQFYDIKRGPVHFFFLDSYGSGPAANGPGGSSIGGTGAASGKGQADLSSTGPMATWLKLTMATSDCPIRIVVMHHPPYTSDTTSASYYPGYEVLRWPWAEWGTDLLICGHTHGYERIIMPDGCTMVTVGLGGHSKRTYNNTSNVYGSQVRYSDKFGFLYGEASDSVFTCQFIDEDGNVQDTFSKGVSRELQLCYRGDFSRQPRKLVVTPTTKKLQVNTKHPFRAYIEYSNGYKEEVTLKASWSVSDSKIAVAENTGNVQAKEVGTCEVIASYEGLTGIADLEVRYTCVDTPLDVIVAVDVSQSMNITSSSVTGESRLDRAKEGLELFLDSAAKSGTDYVGLMTFSGEYKDQTARINEIVGLTDDIGSLYQDVKNIESYEYTAVADGLSTAHKMVNEYTEDGHKKVIVLFTDGVSNIVSSDLNSSRVLPTYNGPGLATNYVAVFNQAMTAATTQATAIKNDNITLIVIGYDVKRFTSYYSTITGWATTGLYYDAESGDELVDTFSDLFLDLCEKEEEETSGAGAGTANP